MLTNAAAKAAGARTRAYKLADSGGLFLYVAPTGTKSWRLKYRFAGREKLLTLGRFPEIGVPEARRRREEAKARLREGIDPAARRELFDTFEQLARAWFEHNRGNWSDAHAADVLASLERDLFPRLAKMVISDIDAPRLLNALRIVEARGCIETARRIRQRLSAIFGYGIALKLVDIDPAAQLGRAMSAARPPRPMPALTSIEDCRALLAACDHLVAANMMVRLASRFLALTAVRLAAVRGMRWSEVNFETRTWTVPAERMKLSRAKKELDRFDHVVPLSAAAIAVLKAARQNGYDTHSGGLVFPGRSGTSPLGEGALRDLYRRAGFGARHVPHGWRSSFSTILNEHLGPEWRADIDRALAHSPKDKVEAAYNRSALLDRRRRLFDRWGEMLST